MKEEEGRVLEKKETIFTSLLKQRNDIYFMNAPTEFCQLPANDCLVVSSLFSVPTMLC